MSLASREESKIEQYVDAVGSRRGGGYELKAVELARLLRIEGERDAQRQELLTALQKALPLPRGEGNDSPNASLIEELKGTLTNVIIMQTRLNERWDTLLGQLDEAAEEGMVKGIAMDPEVVRQWGRGILRACRHLKETVSEAST